MGRGRGRPGVLALLVIGPVGAASAAPGERILSFEAEYDVQADGSVKVTEHLTWQFAGSDSHGIKRNIITSQGYDPQPDKYRVYPMSDIRVSSPTGAPADVDRQQFGANTVLRIGDPDETVSGTQKYDISYTLGHVVNAQPEHVELYWNVTGAQTSIPTDQVKITVRGPGGVTKAACYYGLTQESKRCTAAPGQAATYTASGLQGWEQVTVVAAFAKGGFTSTPHPSCVRAVPTPTTSRTAASSATASPPISAAPCRASRSVPASRCRRSRRPRWACWSGSADATSDTPQRCPV